MILATDTTTYEPCKNMQKPYQNVTGAILVIVSTQTTRKQDVMLRINKRLRGLTEADLPCQCYRCRTDGL